MYADVGATGAFWIIQQHSEERTRHVRPTVRTTCPSLRAWFRSMPKANGQELIRKGTPLKPLRKASHHLRFGNLIFLPEVTSHQRRPEMHHFLSKNEIIEPM